MKKKEKIAYVSLLITLFLIGMLLGIVYVQIT